MQKIKINIFRDIFYFVWDNKQDTIDIINEYLKLTKDENWSCGRCWDENTQSNTSNTLYISVKKGTAKYSSFYQVGDYLLDNGNYFEKHSKEGFDEKILKLKGY